MQQYILIKVWDIYEYAANISLNVPDISIYIPDITGDVPDISRKPVLPIFKLKQQFWKDSAYWAGLELEFFFLVLLKNSFISETKTSIPSTLS